MAGESLDPLRQDKARKYARLVRKLFFVDLALGAAFLLILLLGDLSVGLRNFLDLPQPARVALYVIILALCYGMILAPLTLYSGFILPRRYGLLTQALSGWLRDMVKGGLVGLVLGVGVMVVVYWLLGSFPQTWWLLAAAFMVLLSVILTKLAPLIIVPLFFKLRPLANADLSQRLARLAQRARIKVCGVFTINLSSKSTTANAGLMGLGNTRSIVLADTLLDRYSSDEIEVVLAHEVAHHAHGDIARLIVVQSVVTLGGFYLASLILNWSVPRFGFGGIADVAAFPLLALAVGVLMLLVRPVTNAYSRHLERAADEYALKMTQNPQGFIDVMTKLTNQNLSESEPSRWVEVFFYDHPPYLKRVACAREFAARQPGGLPLGQEL